MILIFIGPPGSGKGTIASLFAQKGWVPFSTGQALRNHVKNRGKYSKEVSDLLQHGHLARDKVVYDVMSESLRALRGKNIIFDGFPRNVEQVKSARRILKDLHRDIDAFVFIDTPQKEILSRLKVRRQCEKCGRIYGKHAKPKRKGICDVDKGKLILRNDDKPLVIKERFRVFYRETFPVLEEASKIYPVFHIDGAGSPRTVFKRVENVVSLLK